MHYKAHSLFQVICVAYIIFFRFTYRSASRTAATSKMEHFVIIFNSWKPLTVITKCSILDVVAALDPPLKIEKLEFFCFFF